MYLRGYQGFVPRWAGGALVSWLAQPFNNFVLGQDKHAVGGQRPLDTDHARGETLLEYDSAIAAYRKMRRRRQKGQGRELPQLEA